MRDVNNPPEVIGPAPPLRLSLWSPQLTPTQGQPQIGFSSDAGVFASAVRSFFAPDQQKLGVSESDLALGPSHQ